MPDTKLALPAAAALETAKAAIRDHINVNSERSWRADWSSFLAYCEGQGLESKPAAAGTVAAYLWAEHQAGRKPATIRHRAATIAKAHRTADLPDPTKAEIVRQLLKTIDGIQGTRQKQAAGLTHDHVREIVGATKRSERPKDVRDLAMLLAGRDLLARANELVALKYEDLAWQDNGTARVSLRRKKTDTDTGTYLLAAEAAAAVRRWLDVAGITSGPIFVTLTKHGSVRRGEDGQARAINVRDVSRVLGALAKQADLGHFSGHSLRVGMAQDLLAAGIDGALIQQAAGWKTPRMLTRYTAELEADRGAIAQYHNKRKFR